MHAVPLARRFTAIPLAYQKDDVSLDEVWPGLAGGRRDGWDVLLEQFRVVILADAGAGKTYELRSAAERLQQDGRPAFFIRIEDIDEDFGTAFEIGTDQQFSDWLAGAGEAWFFLDSVDEVRLRTPRAFETALRAFAGRIRPARQRAHIYISGRPYAWRSLIDRALVEELLPFDPRIAAPLEDDGSGDEAIEGGAILGGIAPADNKDSAEVEPPLRLYLLAPLDDGDIRVFAEHSGIFEPSRFLEELDRLAFLPMARLPFDLHDLIATWIDTGALAGRLALLVNGITRQLNACGSSTPTLSAERAEAGAGLLAVGALLTGRSNFMVPGSDDPGVTSATGAIDPLELLPEWSKAEIVTLLSTGIFGDPIYGEVRFRHREVRELLAAGWFHRNLFRVGGRARVEELFFRSQYGEDILTPRLRPVLPWLILFDDSIRQRVLVDHPEVAIEGGDAARLPLDVRQAMLTSLIGHLRNPRSYLRGLDNSAIARIAQLDMQSHVQALIDAHSASDDAIFVLGRLVWQGKLVSCVPDLSLIAADPSRGIYARLVSIRAVAALGSPEQIHSLWKSMNDLEQRIPRRLLAEMVDNAPATIETIRLLLNSIERLENRVQFEVTGLNKALIGFVDRIPIAVDARGERLLTVMTAGLNRFLGREPHVERGHCRVSETYQWLMSPALRCIERLVVARSPDALSETALTILGGVPALRFWRGDDFPERRSILEGLVPKWPELNDALFWWAVEAYRDARTDEDARLVDDWPISWIGHFWSFPATTFARTLAWIRGRDLPDDRLIALSRTVRTYAENGRPAAWLADLREVVSGDAGLEAALQLVLNPPTSRDAEESRQYERNLRRQERMRDAQKEAARTEFAARLAANPDLVRNPPGLRSGQFSGDQYKLMRMIERDDFSTGRAQGADWRSLTDVFGPEVAAAYRDAATGFWRDYKPGLRSEGHDSSQVPYALLFAMAGLDIEMSDKDLRKLTPASVRRALRYVPWELNGFPRWFELLYKTWPKLSKAFLWNEVRWELETSTPDKSLHYVLSDIVYYAPWLHLEFGPLIFDWLSHNPAPNDDCLRHCRSIMMGGGLTASAIANLSFAKIGDPATPVAHMPTWHALRTDADPALAIPAVTRLYDKRVLEDPSLFGSAFSVALLGGRDGVSPTFGRFRKPSYLKQLYLLAHRSILVSDDVERAGKGVYSPTLRDDAQDARERFFALLTEIPGPLTHRTIVELSVEHPETGYRDFMTGRAYLRAVADGDLHEWSTAEVARFARRMEALAVNCGGASDAEA